MQPSYPPTKSGGLAQDMANVLAYLQAQAAFPSPSVRGVSGEIVAWPAATAPNYALIADGSAVSRTTYGALFFLMGTTFGPGDGSTTFNLPNVAAALPVGAAWIIWS